MALTEAQKNFYQGVRIVNVTADTSDLYDRYGAALYGCILKVMPDKQQADQVFRDCMTAIRQSSTNIDLKNQKLFTWLLSVAIDACIKATELSRSVIVSKILETDFRQSHSLAPTMRVIRDRSNPIHTNH